MKLESFEQLFFALLSDIYFVENQLVKDLPAMEKKAFSDELKSGIHHHLQETKEQVKRLDKIFEIIGVRPKKMEWTGEIKNIFVDIESFLKENSPSPLLDAAMIAIAQRVEHFEIATYGTLKEFAKVLDQEEIKSLVNETLKEESSADTLLTKAAKGNWFNKGVNVLAAHRE